MTTGEPTVTDLLELIGVREVVQGLFDGRETLTTTRSQIHAARNTFHTTDFDHVAILDLVEDQIAEVEEVIEAQAEPLQAIEAAATAVDLDFRAPEDRLPTPDELILIDELRHDIGRIMDRLVADLQSEIDNAEDAVLDAVAAEEEAAEELEYYAAERNTAEDEAAEAYAAYLAALEQWDEHRPEPE